MCKRKQSPASDSSSSARIAAAKAAVRAAMAPASLLRPGCLACWDLAGFRPGSGSPRMPRIQERVALCARKFCSARSAWYLESSKGTSRVNTHSHASQPYCWRQRSLASKQAASGLVGACPSYPRRRAPRASRRARPAPRAPRMPCARRRPCRGRCRCGGPPCAHQRVRLLSGSLPAYVRKKHLQKTTARGS